MTQPEPLKEWCKGYITGIVCGAGGLATGLAFGQTLTPVSAVSEINPWIAGLALACAVLVVLVILARSGHLGGIAGAAAAAKSAVTDVHEKAAQASSMLGNLKGEIEAAHSAAKAYRAAHAVPAKPAVVAPSLSGSGSLAAKPVDYSNPFK